MIIHGDAREVLPTLDLSGSVVITDPPWASGGKVDIIGAGEGAAALWASVAALLGTARAVVVYQPSLDAPLAAPPLPFVQTCWMRIIPTPYRGRRLLSYVSYVYGDPPMPPGNRCWAAETASVTTAAAAAERRRNAHPCRMSLSHARFLVRWFASGCRVVDPFCGGGAILRAAAERGLDVLGIEADERWLEVARKEVDIGQRQTLMSLIQPMQGLAGEGT